MRIGVWIDEFRPLPEVVAAVDQAARLGFARAWVGERGGWDPLTLITAIGDRGIDLGTAVTTIYPRHPLVLAGQALTASAAVGRVTLGIGPSHQPLVEGRYGGRWERPGTYTAEYLRILGPALRGEQVDVDGSLVRAHGTIIAPGAPVPQLLLSAHGPRLLRLAGEQADGVITTWAGPRGIGEHVVPAVTAAAAGRAAPEIVAGVILALTTDPDGVRTAVDAEFGPAAQLPSYRASFDREGWRGPGDSVVAGDEAALAAAVRSFADAGVTELQVVAIGSSVERERTLTAVAALAPRSTSADPQATPAHVGAASPSAERASRTTRPPRVDPPRPGQRHRPGSPPERPA